MDVCIIINKLHVYNPISLMYIYIYNICVMLAASPQLTFKLLEITFIFSHLTNSLQVWKTHGVYEAHSH